MVTSHGWHNSIYEETKDLMKKLQETRERVNDCSMKTESVNIDSFNKFQIKQRKLLRGHLAKVHCIDWSSDSSSLISASQDGHVIVWDALTTNKIAAIPLRSSWVMTCCYSPCGSLVISGGLDNICSVFSLRSEPGTAKYIKELKGHDAYISSCKFIDDNKMVSVSGDKTSKLWDVETGAAISTFCSHTKDILCLDVETNMSNFIFATGSCDKTLKLWDVRTKKCVQTFFDHENDVNSISFFPNGNAIGTACEDGVARLFSLRSDQIIGEYSQNVGPKTNCLTSIGFSKSGRLLFTGRQDNQIQIHDTIKQEHIYSHDAHTSVIQCLSFSPDRTAFATGSWDTLIKIWL